MNINNENKMIIIIKRTKCDRFDIKSKDRAFDDFLDDHLKHCICSQND